MVDTLWRRLLALEIEKKRVEKKEREKGSSLEAVLADRNARAHIFCGKPKDNVFGIDSREFESQIQSNPSMELELPLHTPGSSLRDYWHPALPPNPPKTPPLSKTRPFGTHYGEKQRGTAWHGEWGVAIDSQGSQRESSPTASHRTESRLVQNVSRQGQGQLHSSRGPSPWGLGGVSPVGAQGVSDCATRMPCLSGLPDCTRS